MSGLNTRSLLAFAHDVLAVVAAWLLAYWLRLNLDIPNAFLASMSCANANRERVFRPDKVDTGRMAELGVG